MSDTALTRTPFIATRRQIFAGGAALAAVGMSTAPTTAHAATPAEQSRAGSGVDRATIQRWARDTWASLAAMTDPKTGLPADNISGPLASPTRSGYTSPTNIGGY
ncbi:MAG: cellobiose phosphorylase, partial [Dermatophilaceae bacterium]